MATVEKDIIATEEDANNVIYLKNLNFSTTEATLREYLIKLFGESSLKSVRLVSKLDNGKQKSMGYAFAEFVDRDAAIKAMKRCHGDFLEGKKLELKFSTKQKAANKKERKFAQDVKPTTKIVVRNLPFQAAKKDIYQLFSAFAQIKSVRIPKKFDKTPRGFCFVEFLTKQEAKNAFESLTNTHLYGRKLVLEFAADDTSVDSIREKTSKDFEKHK